MNSQGKKVQFRPQCERSICTPSQNSNKRKTQNTLTITLYLHYIYAITQNQIILTGKSDIFGDAASVWPLRIQTVGSLNITSHHNSALVITKWCTNCEVGFCKGIHVTITVAERAHQKCRQVHRVTRMRQQKVAILQVRKLSLPRCRRFSGWRLRISTTEEDESLSGFFGLGWRSLSNLCHSCPF